MNKPDKAELKMLAVRLPGEVVTSVKTYASSHNIGLHTLISELVQNGIAQDMGRLNKTALPGSHSTRDAFTMYRKAQAKGEIIPWSEKKMLAVRISPDLMKALKEYAVSVKKNMSLLVEEFIHTGLAARKGETLDAQTLAFLTRKSASPFRARKSRKKTIQEKN